MAIMQGDGHRDYRREGPSEDDLATGGGLHTSTVPALPRIPSTSEMSDGWIDAGVESEATHSTPSQPYNATDLLRAESAASAPSSVTAPATALPLRAQHTNNPFLRKSSVAEAELSTSHGDRSHAAAWAELIPEADKGKGVLDSNVSQSTSLVEFEPQYEAGQKGKAPTLDYMGMPNRQENGKVEGSSAISQPQFQPAEEYAPPPGPPPNHTEEYAPPPGSPPNRVKPLPPPPGPPPGKAETYQIKHVRWVDSESENIRTTPILMQALNGPCPLIAIVNALTLSTPRNRESSLVEALRTREQVSLGLLLDAVVEELITNRMNPKAELPDMIELYDFLRALHFGMNVNPSFVGATEAPNLIDFEPESPRPRTKLPGGFESTKEMRLYSTFNIPLIHGWLPPPSHPVYSALERNARTHEDAENLLTREEELEEKLSKEGLSEDEQRLLQDVSTIKHFLGASATQLTGYGLDTISETMPAGSFAILFRNNHFSTLYRHPSGPVYSLVTDMGYIKYPEIIWESLVDINGLGAELFSGDFRGVSHGSNAPVMGTDEYSSNVSNEWTTVDRSKGKPSSQAASSTHPARSSSQTAANSRAQEEQADADLALALQLQEEEEERHRRESSARTTGNQQSDGRRQSGLRTSGSTPIQSTTPRRVSLRPNNHRQPENSSASSSTSTVNRPARGPQPNNSPFASSSVLRRPTVTTTAPATVRASEDAPPPTYESALAEQPYHPPESSQHHHSSPLPSPIAPTSSGGAAINFDELMARAEADQPSSTRTRARQVSSPQMHHMSSAYSNTARQRRGSASIGQDGPERRDRDRDCAIM